MRRDRSDAGTGWHERRRSRSMINASAVTAVIAVAVVVSILVTRGG